MSISFGQDYDDPWTLRPGMPGEAHSQPEAPALRIETIESVEPLDTQLGVFPKRTVPDSLFDALFGQPDPSPTEIEAAGGDASAVPSMQTFALLDAAKVMNLPELLEDSGLEHRCLFKGDAYDEMKDVAPWVVRLEENNSFTRNLFTRSDAPWHLWDNEPGIYVRSRENLDCMWRHFRKFTRVRDESGKWYYFRFWEPEYASRYFLVISNDFPKKASAWFTVNHVSTSRIGIRCGREFTVFSPSNTTQDQDGSNCTFCYGQPERDAHQWVKRRHFMTKLNRHLTNSSERFALLEESKRHQFSRHLVKEAEKNGITIERAVADYAMASILLWQDIGRLPEGQEMLASNFNQVDKGKGLLRIAVSRK
ncbi:MAG: DUF4123 domain-containing protein [Hyphomicrobiaceae bacterium]